MNALLTTNQPLTMTSTDLLVLINQARLDAGEKSVRHNDLMARIEDELEGFNYETFVVQNKNNTESRVANLSSEQCLLVSMRESKLVRRSIMAKLKELEQQPQFKIPQTLPEALQLAADLAKEIEENKPKIAVYEQLADRKTDVSTTLLAKQLGTTAIKLNRFLRDQGIKMQQIDAPKAGYQDWLNVISDVKNGHEFTQCLVTPHGQIEITKLWQKNN